MRITSVLIAFSVLVAALVTGHTAASAAPSQPRYYLALGDSLAAGEMPGAASTNEGYVDDLYAGLHAQNSALQLVKFGCSGETTTTMKNGGICTYSAGSQLAAAEQFLRAHRGSVEYVTLDIGGNDIDKCVVATGIDQSCVNAGLVTIGKNLLTILAGLRLAGDSHTTFTAMTYYDPFLAAWLLGTADGQALAHQSATITDTLNGLETFEYSLLGFDVAPVAVAFKTNDFTDQVTVPGVGQLPVNVATICELTFMCAVQDDHPTVTGYQLIAQSFSATIARSTRH